MNSLGLSPLQRTYPLALAEASTCISMCWQHSSIRSTDICVQISTLCIKWYFKISWPKPYVILPSLLPSHQGEDVLFLENNVSSWGNRSYISAFEGGNSYQQPISYPPQFLITWRERGEAQKQTEQTPKLRRLQNTINYPWLNMYVGLCTEHSHEFSLERQTRPLTSWCLALTLSSAQPLRKGQEGGGTQDWTLPRGSTLLSPSFTMRALVELSPEDWIGISNGNLEP